MPPLVSTQDEDDEDLPSLVEIIKETQPLTSSPQYKSEVVDSRYEPLADLLTHVDGSPWEVNYYSQLKTIDGAPEPQQPDQHGVYQQYINIKDLELRVTSALSYTQNQETNETELQGSATLYPGIIANIGDMFTADVGDGREGLFKINTVAKSTFFKDACYVITYTFTGSVTSNQTRINDLNEKTVKVEYFRKEFLNHGKHHRLVAKEIVSLEKLRNYSEDLLGTYFGLFYSREYQTFTMPNKALPTYDPFVVKFMLAMVNTGDNPLVSKLREFNIEAEHSGDSNLWSILLDMDFSLLPIARKKMWLVPCRSFNPWPLYGTIYHSRMDSVVYPLNQFPGSYAEATAGGSLLYELDPPGLDTVFSRFALTGFDEVEPDSDGLPDDPILPPIIHPVTKDDYYVFSAAFYNKDAFRQSRLELMVSNALAGKKFDVQFILDACVDSKDWGLVEKFYYIPILLVLLQIGVRNL